MADLSDLIEAIETNNITLIKNILKAEPALANANDSSTGETVLMFASKHGTSSTVIELLAHGANVNAKMTDGMTPLIIACGENQLYIIKLLLTHGAKINAATTDGITSLMVACNNGNLQICKLLVNNAADISMESKVNHYTARDFAFLEDRHAIVAFLDKTARERGKNLKWLKAAELNVPPDVEGLIGEYLSGHTGREYPSKTKRRHMNLLEGQRKSLLADTTSGHIRRRQLGMNPDYKRWNKFIEDLPNPPPRASLFEGGRRIRKLRKTRKIRRV